MSAVYQLEGPSTSALQTRRVATTLREHEYPLQDRSYIHNVKDSHAVSNIALNEDLAIEIKAHVMT